MGHKYLKKIIEISVSFSKVISVSAYLMKKDSPLTTKCKRQIIKMVVHLKMVSPTLSLRFLINKRVHGLQFETHTKKSEIRSIYARCTGNFLKVIFRKLTYRPLFHFGQEKQIQHIP